MLPPADPIRAHSFSWQATSAVQVSRPLRPDLRPGVSLALAPLLAGLNLARRQARRARGARPAPPLARRVRAEGAWDGDVGVVEREESISADDLRLLELKTQQAKVRQRMEAWRVRHRFSFQDLMKHVEELSGTSWRMILQPESGLWYYHNEVSGSLSWEPPADAPLVAPCRLETASKWKLVLDLQSGGWYYFDEEAASSSWDAPEGAPAMALCPPQPPRPWRRVLHVASRDWCFHNEDTGETHWEVPQPEPELKTQQPQQPQQRQQPQQPQFQQQPLRPAEAPRAAAVEAEVVPAWEVLRRRRK